jgi:hypothetical protein
MRRLAPLLSLLLASAPVGAESGWLHVAPDDASCAALGCIGTLRLDVIESGQILHVIFALPEPAALTIVEAAIESESLEWQGTCQAVAVPQPRFPELTDRIFAAACILPDHEPLEITGRWSLEVDAGGQRVSHPTVAVD